MKKVLTIGWAVLLAFATISCGGDEKKTSIGKIESESAANKQEKVRVDTIRTEMIERENEIPMQESMDKMTFQIAMIVTAYLLSYFLLFLQ